MKKKICALFLALALTLSLSSPAYADETPFSVSLAISGKNSTITISSFCNGDALTAAATVADLKDTLLLIGQTNGPVVTDNTVSAPRTLGGVVISWNGTELADDLTYAEILTMAEEASTNLTTIPLTVTLPSMDENYTYVEISWTNFNMEYDYGEWDPQTHVWNSTWSAVDVDGETAVVTIKNYSTNSISYTVTFEKSDGYEVSVEGLSHEAKTLDGAAGKLANAIPTAEIPITLISAPTTDLAIAEQLFTIGTLTVTLADGSQDADIQGSSAILGGDTGANRAAIPITGNLKLKSVKREVYCVDVAWGSMEFTYTPRWNPNSHTYEHSSESWSCEKDANKITVTNHSSAPVNVAVRYSKIDEDSAVSGRFTVEGNTVLTAATSENGAPSLTTYLELSGVLSATETEGQVIGSVTVTIGSDG